MNEIPRFFQAIHEIFWVLYEAVVSTHTVYYANKDEKLTQQIVVSGQEQNDGVEM